MVRELKLALSRDWAELAQTFPVDLEATAQASGAFHYSRKVQSATDLLRLVLMYAVTGSLRLTVLWAASLGLCDLSHQALEERVLRSTAWLRYLLGQVLAHTATLPSTLPSPVRRLILRDATVIARPKSPGTEWRVHLNWDLFALRPVGLTLTDAHTGEGVTPADVQAGDLLVADRAYGRWRPIAVVLDAAAFFIFRLAWSNLPLQTPDGQPFDLLAWLRALPSATRHAEVTLQATHDPQHRPLRLVAGRLPPDKAAEAQAAVRQKAHHDRHPVHPQTLFAATFCLLLTNLPATAWPTPLILAIYRLRWQIEWCFRRCKSLCLLDVLPAYPAPIAEPLLLAKLLLIVLLQRALGALPWADWWAAETPPPALSLLVQLAYAQLRELLCPAAALLEILTTPARFARHLGASRRTRLTQMVGAFQLLQNPATPPAPS